MLSKRVETTLEFNKIKDKLASFAVLYETKKEINNLQPSSDYNQVIKLLDETDEASKLLYDYGVSGIEFFDEITDELDMANMGSTLSMAALLRVMRLLRSSRIIQKSILSVTDDSIVILPQYARQIYVNFHLEDDIYTKILSEDQMADTASEKLFQIRRNIKRLNAQIREKLQSYIRESNSKYLQDNIVTMRGDRYVIPVKAEHKSQVKGLVHDQSASGSTVFIEPIEILELNNDLREQTIAEAQEIEAILFDLSHSVGLIAEQLKYNVISVVKIDLAYAKAIYAYKTRAIRPAINSYGYINVINGRHPLIDSNKVVPLNVTLGKNFNYLLITGPNTGGKTVTLKMVGLFTVMAMSGLFVQAEKSSELSIFNEIFCDIGDEQSIEQSLSTFSSHMSNLINITNKVNDNCLVLLDEIGAGTDPDEGSAIAIAVIDYLISKGSFGIITTHYSALKEYAYTHDKIENASMDFDPVTFAPKYRLNIGLPGSSNAIEIASRLGLNKDIINSAYGNLSENKINFENVLKEAEKSRQKAEEENIEHQKLTQKAKEELNKVSSERKKFEEEKSKFYTKAKIESRRIINEKEEEADELLQQIKDILKKQEITQTDIFKARNLKNQILDKKYQVEEEEDTFIVGEALPKEKILPGAKVYVKSLNVNGEISRVNSKKNTCEIISNNLRYNVKFSDLFCVTENSKKSKTTINYKRPSLGQTVKNEINVIGLASDEALLEVDSFLDKMLVAGYEEAKIIHGVGMQILSKSIHAHLRKCKFIKEFRFGKYGEGEHGVTIIKFK